MSCAFASADTAPSAILLAMSVSTNALTWTTPRLIATGRYVRPTLGVRFDPQINQALIQQVGTRGVFVLAVEPGSPAAAAGLQPARIGRNESIVIGDVITAIDERPITKVDDLIDALDHAAPGQEVNVTLQRASQQLQVQAKLAAGR